MFGTKKVKIENSVKATISNGRVKLNADLQYEPGVAVISSLSDDVECVVEIRKKFNEDDFTNELQSTVEIPETDLYDHQIEAIEVFTALMENRLTVNHVTKEKIDGMSNVKISNNVIDNAEDKGIIELPTGSGKTRIFQECVGNLEMDISIISAPGIDLIHQIDGVLERALDPTVFEYMVVNSSNDIKATANDPEFLKELLYYQQSKRYIKEDEIIEAISSKMATGKKLVIFVTHYSLSKVGDCLTKMGLESDVVIYDEGHQAMRGGKDIVDDYGNPDLEAIMEKNNVCSTLISFPTKHKVFFTATTKEKHSNTETLHDYGMHKTEYYGEVIYRKTPAQMFERGIILEPKVIKTSWNDVIVREYERFFESMDTSFHSKDDSNILKQECILFVAGLIEIYKKENKLKNIAFVRNVDVIYWYVDHQEKINNIINDILGLSGIEPIDIKFFGIDSNIVGKDRLLLLEAFNNVEHGILFNYRVIREGIDIKDCNSVAIMQGMSSVDIVQAVGRSLRKDYGKHYGYVITPIGYGDYNSKIDNFADICFSLFDNGYKDIVVCEMTYDERRTGTSGDSTNKSQYDDSALKYDDVRITEEELKDRLSKTKAEELTRKHKDKSNKGLNQFFK